MDLGLLHTREPAASGLSEDMARVQGSEAPQTHGSSCCTRLSALQGPTSAPAAGRGKGRAAKKGAAAGKAKGGKKGAAAAAAAAAEAEVEAEAEAKREEEEAPAGEPEEDDVPMLSSQDMTLPR